MYSIGQNVTRLHQQKYYIVHCSRRYELQQSNQQQYEIEKPFRTSGINFKPNLPLHVGHLYILTVSRSLDKNRSPYCQCLNNSSP